MKTQSKVFAAVVSLAAACATLVANPQIVPFNSDAGTGWVGGKNYTHAVNFGRTGNNPVVMGVTFMKTTAPTMPASGTTRGYGWENFPPLGNHDGGSMNQMSTPSSGHGVYDFMIDMIYNLNNQTMRLTVLKPGFEYEARFVNRVWGNGGTDRWQTFTFMPRGEGPGDLREPIEFNQDNTAVRDNMLVYRYRVGANGKLAIHVLPSNTNNSWHCYGFTNEETAKNIAVENVAQVGKNNTLFDARIFPAGVPSTVKAFWGTEDFGETEDGWDVGSAAVDVFSEDTKFQFAATGLAGDSNYVVRVMMTNENMFVWSDMFVFETMGDEILIAVSDPENLRGGSATAAGALHYAAGEPDADVTLYWGTFDGGKNHGTWDRAPIPMGLQPLGPLAWPLSGLDCYTNYTYRFYAEAPGNPSLSEWSDPAEFTVPGAAVLGVAADVTTVADTTAVMTCELLDVGGAPVDAVCWFGTDPAALAPLETWDGLEEPQTLLCTHTALAAGNTYYYAFSATNVMENGHVYEVWTATNSISFMNAKVWTGGGDGVNWTNAPNWTGGVPTATDTAIFADTNPGTVRLDGNRAVYKLRIETAGGFNIGAVDERAAPHSLRVTEIERADTAAGNHDFNVPLEVVADAEGKALWALGGGAMRIYGNLRGDAGCETTRTGAAQLYFGSRSDYTGSWLFREGYSTTASGENTFRGGMVVGGGENAAQFNAHAKNAIHGNGAVTVVTNGFFNHGSDIDGGRVWGVVVEEGGDANIGGWWFYCMNARLQGGTLRGGGRFFSGGWGNSIVSLASDVPAFFNCGYDFSGTGGYYANLDVPNGGAIIDLTINGVISGGPGNAEMQKRHPGTLRLTAANGINYNAFSVTAGTVLADNTAGSAVGRCPVNVHAGATLGGTGIIGGRVNDASNVTFFSGNAGSFAVCAPGTIDPATGGHIIGTLTVGSAVQTNNVIFGNYARLRATIGADFANDRLTVFGLATIFATGTTLEITVSPEAKAGTYVLASADNGVAGTFANVVVNGETTPRLTKRVAYTGTEVLYTIPPSETVVILR